MDAFDGVTEQVAEVSMIAGDQMTASCLNGSQWDRLALRYQGGALWQRGRRRCVIGDLDLLDEPIQARPVVGRLEIAFRFSDRIRRTDQSQAVQTPERERRRDIAPPCGGEEDVGVEEGAVGLQRECGRTCGTVSGSRPSAFTSRRATRYSASVPALFSRNSALRAGV